MRQTNAETNPQGSVTPAAGPARTRLQAAPPLDFRFWQDGAGHLPPIHLQVEERRYTLLPTPRLRAAHGPPGGRVDAVNDIPHLLVGDPALEEDYQWIARLLAENGLSGAGLHPARAEQDGLVVAPLLGAWRHARHELLGRDLASLIQDRDPSWQRYRHRGQALPAEADYALVTPRFSLQGYLCQPEAPRGGL